jgi:serine/threonine protein kinase
MISNSESILDYDVMEQIGKGAFGTVKRGVHRDTQEEVAIKSVQKQLIASTGKKRSVFREKEILNTLDHPNVIKLLHTTQVSTQSISNANILYFCTG